MESDHIGTRLGSRDGLQCRAQAGPGPVRPWGPARHFEPVLNMVTFCIVPIWSSMCFGYFAEGTMQKKTRLALPIICFEAGSTGVKAYMTCAMFLVSSVLVPTAMWFVLIRAMVGATYALEITLLLGLALHRPCAPKTNFGEGIRKYGFTNNELWFALLCYS